MLSRAMLLRECSARSLGPHKAFAVAFLQVDDLRGSPMSVGTLEEIVDDKCAHLDAAATSRHAACIPF